LRREERRGLDLDKSRSVKGVVILFSKREKLWERGERGRVFKSSSTERGHSPAKIERNRRTSKF